MRVVQIATISLLALTLSGCALFSLNPCDNRIEQIRAQRGTPEDVRRFSSGAHRSVTYHYWRQGISYNFRSGPGYVGCRVSIHQYPRRTW